MEWAGFVARENGCGRDDWLEEKILFFLIMWGYQRDGSYGLRLSTISVSVMGGPQICKHKELVTGSSIS